MSLLDLDVTKVVYVGAPDADGKRGKVWHLAGPNAGDEGAILGPNPKGLMFAPFELLTSSGARQDGATFLRSVRHKRDGDITIQLGGDTVRAFQTVHDEWFRSWNSDVPGHLGLYTKYAGWRFHPVHFADDPEPTTGVDPAFNCFESYEMSYTAMDPLYRTFDEENTWTNELGLNEGLLRSRNAADQRSWPRYTMNGPGRFYIEDPLPVDDEIRIVQTPMLLAGETLRINTHERRPTARLYSTIYGENYRNVWGQLKGRRWLFAVRPWRSEEIVVRVEGGNTMSSIIVASTPRFSRPF